MTRPTPSTPAPHSLARSVQAGAAYPALAAPNGGAADAGSTPASGAMTATHNSFTGAPTPRRTAATRRAEHLRPAWEQPMAEAKFWLLWHDTVIETRCQPKHHLRGLTQYQREQMELDASWAPPRPTMRQALQVLEFRVAQQRRAGDLSVEQDRAARAYVRDCQAELDKLRDQAEAGTSCRRDQQLDHHEVVMRKPRNPADRGANGRRRAEGPRNPDTGKAGAPKPFACWQEKRALAQARNAEADYEPVYSSAQDMALGLPAGQVEVGARLGAYTAAATFGGRPKPRPDRQILRQDRRQEREGAAIDQRRNLQRTMARFNRARDLEVQAETATLVLPDRGAAAIGSVRHTMAALPPTVTAAPGTFNCEPSNTGRAGPKPKAPNKRPRGRRSGNRGRRSAE
jgi:hypothetical protein